MAPVLHSSLGQVISREFSSLCCSSGAHSAETLFLLAFAWMISGNYLADIIWLTWLFSYALSAVKNASNRVWLEIPCAFPRWECPFSPGRISWALLELLLVLALFCLASAHSAGSGQDKAPTNSSNTQRTEHGHLVSLITITRQQKCCNRYTQGSFPLWFCEGMIDWSDM